MTLTPDTALPFVSVILTAGAVATGLPAVALCASPPDFVMIAGSPTVTVNALLDDVWSRALKVTAREQAQLEAMQREAGVADGLQPWDWRYWAEKVRRRDFAIDRPAAGELPDFVAPSPEGWIRIRPGLLEGEGGLDGFFIARLVRGR